MDGAGGRALFPTMWGTGAGTRGRGGAVPLDDVTAAMRLLAGLAHVVAEGAGALALALALRRRRMGSDETFICIVSGGNVDASVLARVLEGETP